MIPRDFVGRFGKCCNARVNHEVPGRNVFVHVWCVDFVVVFMMMFVKMKTTIIFLLYVARGANTVPTHLPRKRKTEACPASIGLGLLHMQWSGGGGSSGRCAQALGATSPHPAGFPGGGV